MTKQEFERLGGYKVSIKKYKEIIEPMYMASPLPKDEFVKTLNKKYFVISKREQIIERLRIYLMWNDETEANYESRPLRVELAQLDGLEHHKYIIKGNKLVKIDFKANVYEVVDEL